MRPFLALLRLDLRSTFGWKPFSEYRRARDWLKLAGALLLGLVLVADIGFIFGASALSQYRALKPQGLQALLLLNGAVMASVAVFFLGFVTILSGWSLSPAEAQLFALPLRDREQLGAKFVVVYLTQALLALFLFGANLLVFGISEGAPVLWWIVGLLAALALPLPALALAWLLVVPLMAGSRFMRNKNAVLVAAGALGVVFALGFNLYVQSSMARIADPAWILANWAGPSTLLNLLGSAWPPSWLAWKALEAAASRKALLGFALVLALLAGGLALSLLVVLTFARAWRRSVLEFGEARIRRTDASGARSFIARNFRRRGAFLALFLREWRLMNREPRFFLNGPFIVVLMPLVLAVVYIAQRDSLAELRVVFEGAEGARNAFMAAVILGGFLGSSTSIAATALSRDAKALPAILALPVGAFEYMLAKLAHALAWALLGALMGAAAMSLALALSPGLALLAALTALAFSAFANLAGLWIDTLSPRLSWDNPMAALKQNPNSVFAILGAMGVLALSAVATAATGAGIGLFALALGGGSLLLFALGLALYSRIAIIKLRDIEPR